MSKPEELALVEKAIRSKLGGCCEWHAKSASRGRSETNLQGLTPEHIRKRRIEFVEEGGSVSQVPERRPEYQHREFYYKVIVTEPGFKRGIFVELELTDDDPDVPAVTILNAHAQ